MIPILYAANETDFTHCGIGVLPEATSCTVTEERNGAFECEFKYPVDGRMSGQIQEQCLIKVKPNEMADPQLFRIYASSKPINGVVTYRAEHISYELSGYPVERVSVENATAGAALSAILNASLITHPYTAQSDIALLKSTVVERKSVRAAFGGTEGSVLSLWGGEFEFDNFTVKLHQARGRKTGIKIAYGKNITDIKQEASIAEMYTAVYPYAKYTVQPTDGQTEPEEITVTLPEKMLYSAKASKATRGRVCIKDFSEAFEGAAAITEEQLRQKAEAWVETSGFDVPSVSITVSFENLWQSPEYAQYALLERCGLCDTVSVEFPALHISTTAKIVKTKYDVLSEKYLQITLGSARANFADTVKGTATAIEQTKQAVKQSSAKVEVDFKKAIDDATNAITGQSGGYVVLNPAKNPQEILIMDAPDLAAAKRVWRWNRGGLGYSKNGYNGAFTTAITQDGAIVADFITAGKISTARLDVQDIIKTGGIAVLGDVQVETERATEEEGKLSTRISATAEGITAEVTRATDAEDELSSRIKLTADEFAAEITRVTEEEGEHYAKISAKADANASAVETLATWKSGVEDDVSSIASISAKADANASAVETLATWKSDVEKDVSSIASISAKADANASKVETLATWKSGVEDDVSSIASISTKAEENAAAITAKVSTTGGNASSFSWSLTEDGFFLKSNGETVMDVTAAGAEVTGKITATAGKIAGFEITGDLLKGQQVGMCGVPGTDYAFWAGSDTGLTAPFRVGHSGEMEATRGTIGGWEINSERLYKRFESGSDYYDVSVNAGLYKGVGSTFADYIKNSTSFIISENGNEVFYIRPNGDAYIGGFHYSFQNGMTYTNNGNGVAIRRYELVGYKNGKSAISVSWYDVCAAVQYMKNANLI